VLTMGNRNGEDSVRCLDGATGREVWTHKYPCKPGSYPGPRATPVVDGASVFAVSREGRLMCLALETGAMQWEVALVSSYGAAPPGWGHSASVKVDGDRLLLNAGESGIALKKASGEKLWASGRDKCGYATPVVFDRGGRRLAAIFAREALYTVDVADGTVLGSFAWKTSYDVNAADPIVFGTRLFISSGYDRGCAMLDASVDPPRALWENRNMRNHFSSCVAVDGMVYGIDGNSGSGDLVCLDPDSGAKRWSAKLGFGSVIAAAGKLIVLTENGTLIVAAASPGAFQELARRDAVLPKICWTAPTLANGRLYVRNHKGSVVALDVR